MILVLEDRYESPLSIDTKKVPVALHLTSQWRFNDVRVTKNWILRILDENRPNFKFSPKSYEYAILMGFLANCEREWLL